jgi:hypothetical protein
LGYDMHFHEEPPELKPLHDAAFGEDGNSKWDQEAASKYFAAQEKLGSYFRLNIWGMGEYRGYMEERGMLWWPEEDGPVDKDYGGVMPGHKFCSNDGWVVTPSEITRALQALEDWEADQRAVRGDQWVDPLNDKEDGYWHKWLRYLYVARSYGGFEVW